MEIKRPHTTQVHRINYVKCSLLWHGPKIGSRGVGGLGQDRGDRVVGEGGRRVWGLR